MNRLAFALLCSAFLAAATAGNAETNAAPLEISAEGLELRIPVPEGFFRIDDLEVDTPVAEAMTAARMSTDGVDGPGQFDKDDPFWPLHDDSGESNRKSFAMWGAIIAIIFAVGSVRDLLKFRKRLLWRYTRFDDFTRNGSTEQPRMPGSKTEIWVESLPREEQEDGAAQPRIDLECSKDGVLMLNGCLSEIHELFCYENRNKTANRFDFEKDIGLPMSETDALRSRIGSAYEEGKDRMTTWRFRFRREELVAILNSIRKLISPRSSLLWELGIRTGFDPDEFSALADRIQSALDTKETE